MPLSRNRLAIGAAACLAAIAGVGVPASALAKSSKATTTTTTSTTSSGSGGVGVGGSGGTPVGGSDTTTTSTTSTTSTTPTTSGPTTAVSLLPVTVTTGSLSLSSARVGETGSYLKLSGTAGKSANQVVVIEDRFRSTASWSVATQTKTKSGGAFSAKWLPTAYGHPQLRAVLLPAGTKPGTAAIARVSQKPGSATASLTGLTVFQAAVASYEENFGNLDSCGSILSSTTIGIASPTLRCGTKVTIYYRGHEMTVPVVDHGPYVGGRSYDLTYAVANDIGMISAGVATIGALH